MHLSTSPGYHEQAVVDFRPGILAIPAACEAPVGTVCLTLQAMLAMLRSRSGQAKLPHVSSTSCLLGMPWDGRSSRSMTPSITPPRRSRRRHHDPRASLSAGDYTSGESSPDDSDSGAEAGSLYVAQIAALQRAASAQSTPSPYW